MVLKNLNNNQSFDKWDNHYKYYSKSLNDEILSNYSDELDFYAFIQYECHSQYFKLKAYANSKNIRIIGDVPIYVSYDSSDVYSHTDYFLLNEDLSPKLVAGVPPDYFSKTGQLWGNPIYNYEKMKEDNYLYWQMRILFASKLYDAIRLDHFRGFEAYYTIKYPAQDAINGTWVKGPDYELLSLFNKVNKNVKFIAEDLGILTKQVYELKNKLRWPGLAIYEFGYSLQDKKFKSNYLPQNMKSNVIGYIGTHDNNTLIGYLNNEVDAKLFKLMKQDLNVKTNLKLILKC